MQISVSTEITDKEKVKGWVLYDADCRFCVGLARRFRGILARRHFKLLPLQTPWVRTRIGLADTELFADMKLLLPDGLSFGGADALLEISRRYWWTWPFRELGRIPGVMHVLRAGYRYLARHRGCTAGACEAKPKLRTRKKIVFFEMP